MGSVCESCSPTGRGKAIGGASAFRMTTALLERQLFPQKICDSFANRPPEGKENGKWCADLEIRIPKKSEDRNQNRKSTEPRLPPGEQGGEPGRRATDKSSARRSRDFGRSRRALLTKSSD